MRLQAESKSSTMSVCYCLSPSSCGRISPCTPLNSTHRRPFILSPTAQPFGQQSYHSIGMQTDPIFMISKLSMPVTPTTHERSNASRYSGLSSNPSSVSSLPSSSIPGSVASTPKLLIQRKCAAEDSSAGATCTIHARTALWVSQTTVSGSLYLADHSASEALEGSNATLQWSMANSHTLALKPCTHVVDLNKSDNDVFGSPMTRNNVNRMTHCHVVVISLDEEDQETAGTRSFARKPFQPRVVVVLSDEEDDSDHEHAATRKPTKRLLPTHIQVVVVSSNEEDESSQEHTHTDPQTPVHTDGMIETPGSAHYGRAQVLACQNGASQPFAGPSGFSIDGLDNGLATGQVTGDPNLNSDRCLSETDLKELERIYA